MAEWINAMGRRVHDMLYTGDITSGTQIVVRVGAETRDMLIETVEVFQAQPPFDFNSRVIRYRQICPHEGSCPTRGHNR